MSPVMPHSVANAVLLCMRGHPRSWLMLLTDMQEMKLHKEAMKKLGKKRQVHLQSKHAVRCLFMFSRRCST